MTKVYDIHIYVVKTAYFKNSLKLNKKKQSGSYIKSQTKVWLKQFDMKKKFKLRKNNWNNNK